MPGEWGEPHELDDRERRGERATGETGADAARVRGIWEREQAEPEAQAFEPEVQERSAPERALAAFDDLSALADLQAAARLPAESGVTRGLTAQERAALEQVHEWSQQRLHLDDQRNLIERLPFARGAAARAAGYWNRLAGHGYLHAANAVVAAAGIPAAVRALDSALAHTDASHADLLSAACLAWSVSRAAWALGRQSYHVIAEGLAARRAQQRSRAAPPP